LIPQISLGASSQPQGIAARADGDVWFTVASAGAVAGTIDVIDPSTDTIINTVPIPTDVVTTPDPLAITAAGDGNFWFVDGAEPTGAVGRVLRDTRLSFSVPPAANINLGSPFRVFVGVTYSDTGGIDYDYQGSVTLAL